MADTSYHVLGAGPAGLLAALGLAKRGGTVTVYELRDSLDQRPEESYPIGVNLRGIRALNNVGSLKLAMQIKETGEIINSFDIFAGKTRVAQQLSGALYSQTRAKVVKLIYNECLEFEKSRTAETKGALKVLFGKKLEAFEVVEDGTLNARLKFADGTLVDVPKGGRVVAADGFGSLIRRTLVAKTKDTPNAITEDLVPWGIKFRMLFADKGVPENMDAKVHSIYSGVYTAISGTPGKDPWVLCVSCRDNAPQAPWFSLNTTSPTPENVDALKAHIRKCAPPFSQVEKYISDEELTSFFSRRIFTGNLTRVSNAQYAGWVVMLGDAAHGLFPPTGEGINSAMDDVNSLMQSFDAAKDGANFFEPYALERQPDIDALHNIAVDIWKMQNGTGAEKVIQLGSTILFGTFKSKSQESEADLRYGPNTKEKDGKFLSYADIWKRHLENVGGYRRTLKWVFAPIKSMREALFGA